MPRRTRDRLAAMITEKHTIRLGEEDWPALIELAARTVKDSELDKSAPPTATRVSPLLRLIAHGNLIVVRTGAADNEHTNG